MLWDWRKKYFGTNFILGASVFTQCNDSLWISKYCNFNYKNSHFFDQLKKKTFDKNFTNGEEQIKIHSLSANLIFRHFQ